MCHVCDGLVTLSFYKAKPSKAGGLKTKILQRFMHKVPLIKKILISSVVSLQNIGLMHSTIFYNTPLQLEGCKFVVLKFDANSYMLTFSNSGS